MKWSWIANDGQECEHRDGKTSHHHPLSWVTLPVISVTTPTALDSFQTDQ